MEIVKTFNLSKYYKGFPALVDANITIEKGDIYGLIGRNGAGKTTLMRIITGLTPQSSGEFTLFGINGADPDSRGKLGAIVEAPALYDNFTGIQNLKAAALLRGIAPDSPKIKEMLTFAGLDSFGGRKVKNYSLGMRQRLALAIILLHDPEFLVLDEPVNGLDPFGIVQTREILKRLNQEKGVTILISSHLLSELEHLATKYGIIERGRVIEEISAPALYAKLTKTLEITLNSADIEPAAELIKIKFGFKVAVAGSRLLVADANIDKKTGEINQMLASANIFVQGFHLSVMDLEQYFIRVTGGGQI